MCDEKDFDIEKIVDYVPIMILRNIITDYSAYLVGLPSGEDNEYTAHTALMEYFADAENNPNEYEEEIYRELKDVLLQKYNEMRIYLGEL